MPKSIAPGAGMSRYLCLVLAGFLIAALVGCSTGDGATHSKRMTYLRGVNAFGGSGSWDNPAKLPGTLGTDYWYGDQEFFDYIASRGHKIVRIDFLWERVQSSLGGPLDATRLQQLKDCVQRAAKAGLVVLLDMKNYGRYWNTDDTQATMGKGITIAQFAQVWSLLATAFKHQPAVVGWGLMNEPHDLPVAPTPGRPLLDSTWKVFSQAAVTAIRATGDSRDVYVAGDQFGGAWGWTNINGDPWIEDPADAVVYEAHIYLDANRSGQYSGTTYAAQEALVVANGWSSLTARAKADMRVFLDWLVKHHQRGFIGEIGWPNTYDSALWNAAGRAVYALANTAGIGITYWAAGEQLSGNGPGGRYALDAYDRDRFIPQSQAEVIEDPRNLSRGRRP